MLVESDVHTVVQLSGVEHVLKLNGAVFAIRVGHSELTGFEAGASAAGEVAVGFGLDISGLEDLHVIGVAADFEATNAFRIADLGAPLEQLAGLGLSNVALLAFVSVNARALVNAAPWLQHINRLQVLNFTSKYLQASLVQS